MLSGSIFRERKTLKINRAPASAVLLGAGDSQLFQLSGRFAKLSSLLCSSAFFEFTVLLPTRDPQ